MTKGASKLKTGGPERDRTAGLLVANYETTQTCNDTEEAQVTRRGSVHPGFCMRLTVSFLSPSGYPREGARGRHCRGTTQTTTQTQPPASDPQVCDLSPGMSFAVGALRAPFPKPPLSLSAKARPFGLRLPHRPQGERSISGLLSRVPGRPAIPTKSNECNSNRQPQS